MIWDTPIAVLIVAVVGHIIAVTVYMVKTNGKANSALDAAEKAQEHSDALAERLRKVEAEHVLGMALRQDFKDFQNTIGDQLTSLRNERREDMRGLHERLNDISMLPPRSIGGA